MLDNATVRSAFLIMLAALGLFAGTATASASNPSTDPDPAAGSQTATGTTGTTGATGTTGGTGKVPVGGNGKSSGRSLNPVRLRLVRNPVRFGHAVRFAGRNGLRSGGRVRIQQRKNGRKGWRTVKRVRANRNGRFRGSFRARFSGRVRAVDARGRASVPKRHAVRSRARLNRPRRTVKLGESVRIRGVVRPHGVRTVKLRIKGSGRSVRLRTRADGSFAYRWKPARAGDVRIRARVLPDRLGRGDGSGLRRISALRPGGASYYGPGLYGNGVACGGTLTPNTRGVAHKSLPCGTKVTIRYGNKVVTARVIDRGPYIAGRDWDLTAATRNQLGFGGTGTVWTNR